MSWEFEKIAGPMQITEGPVWDGSGLLYTNIANNRILRYDPTTGESTEVRTGTNAANGLMLDKNGVLYACEGGGRRMVRYDPVVGDAATGVRILRRALEEPMRMIASNAGLDGPVVIERVRGLQQEGKKTYGYDVIENGYVNMLEAGIIDPAKVTRSAVENACSIAAMILTTSALVTDIPEVEKPMAGGGDMGGMGGMGMGM